MYRSLLFILTILFSIILFSGCGLIQPVIDQLVMDLPDIPTASPAPSATPVLSYEEKTVEEIIPFESQIIRNETIPEGETFVVQVGENGLKRMTYRTAMENGVSISRHHTDQEILKESLPEILMVGMKAEHAPIQIPGKIIYIANGSVWLMEKTTTNRTPLVTTGDLDGRILDLSSNGEWLMFSRKTAKDTLNSLWMLHITNWEAQPISLRVENVVHFAAWLPGESLRFVYSTVEPSESAPGWKANNDLRFKMVSPTGMNMVEEVILPTDESGAYPWWGMNFVLSQDGRKLLYASPSAIGEVDRLTGEKKEWIRIQPYEKTRSDWAWVPGMSWNATEDALFFAYHGAINGSERSNDPADFNLGFYNIDTQKAEALKQSTGLFSQPVASPLLADGKKVVAWLQNVTPSQPESNRYRIMVMNEDGNEAKAVYPLEDGESISPQKVVWSPVRDGNETWIAFLSHGNIWIVNPFTGIYNQITIEQTITKMIWK